MNKKSIKGYIAQIGRNNASSYKYFKNSAKAIEWVKNSIEFEYTQLKQTKFNIKIEEKELTNCKTCNELTEESPCIKCEKQMFDAQAE